MGAKAANNVENRSSEVMYSRWKSRDEVTAETDTIKTDHETKLRKWVPLDAFILDRFGESCLEKIKTSAVVFMILMRGGTRWRVYCKAYVQMKIICIEYHLSILCLNF